MSTTLSNPKTLLQAITFFADKNACVEYLAKRRWPNGVTCKCGSQKVTAIKTRQLWQCKDCRKQFSVKVNSIFEDSPLPLSKWLPCLWLITNAKNGISSCEVARALGVTQKTAWFMLHRIREAMRNGSFEKLSGDVEVDETYIGGASKWKHADKKKHVSGGADKTVVFGAVERGGRVAARVITSQTVPALQAEVINTVAISANLHSDELTAYQGLGKLYRSHGTVNHEQKQYVNGGTHTNNVENYWSLVKRMLKGTYIHVEPFHLDRYLDEQGFRFNNRKNVDGGRFEQICEQVAGVRLTYKELTGVSD